MKAHAASVELVDIWGIGDFKSIVAAQLDLVGPRLNVITGTNSSGKSSLIQSLLMLAQTADRGGQVTLNGPLVRLGTPKDVVRDGQHGMDLSLTIDATETRAGHAAQAIIGALRVRVYLVPIEGNFRAASFEITDSADERLNFEATSSRMNRSDVQELTSQLGDDGISVLRITTENGRRAPMRMYLLLRGIVPVGFALRRSPEWIRRVVSQSLQVLNSGEEMPQRFRSSSLWELSFLVNKPSFLKRHGIERPAGEVRSPYASMRWLPSEFSSLNASTRQELIREAAEARARNEWIVVRNEQRFGVQGFAGLGFVESALALEHDATTNLLNTVAEEILRTGSLVAYLGPLRDEPRVVHSAWHEQRDALPVGIRGEFTAEVLTRRKDSRVVYGDVEGNQRRDPLPEAVAEWCRYLGIGDQIQVLDQGKLGRGVRLRVDGAYRDLTTIGVGASQLLPVLVAVLATDAGSVLLLEQPELHLHPAVQSKLADFFLFARPDLRIIVETHSEYLITRIRRRIAEQRVMPGDVALTFVEQRNGISMPRSIEIAETGDLSSWPEGFFDAQDIDSLAIVRAISRTAST